MEKLVVCVMGENCEKFIGMCLESVKEADAIVYLDGGSTDNTIPFLVLRVFNGSNQNLKAFNDKTIIENKYDQEDKAMNGKQRNFYLSFLKENYPNDWALCLDADEVVDDITKIQEFIQIAQPALYSVKMRHFQQDLGHEDATVEKHWVPNRLFKISEADSYPLVEHPVLQPIRHKERPSTPYSYGIVRHIAEDNTYYIQGFCEVTTVWHLAYIPNLWDIKKRYENHMKKSNMHSPEFLKWWYHNHIFGSYPKKEIKKTDIPKVILDEFGIDKDELYFTDRTIDMKHPLMVKQWTDYFKPTSVLDLGCGRGCYLYFWKWFVQDYYGIELSNWAVNNAFCDRINQGDITQGIACPFTPDLITCIDVLEHLENTELDNCLSLISKMGKDFLFSIPFIGDPNLENDSTHKQFRTKDEWKELISSYGIDISDAPETWLFSNQILIGKKKDINSIV